MNKSDVIVCKEIAVTPKSGWTILLLVFVTALGSLLLLAATMLVAQLSALLPIAAAVSILGLLAACIALAGFIAVPPNEARVLLLFGDYKGTVFHSGFYWVNPFLSKKKISLRIRNFETGSQSTPEKKDAAGQLISPKSRTASRPSKVNDRDGNPIEISAVVVWKVINTAEAMFEVDDYEDFVSVQSEAALRSMASRYPYDSEDHEISLRGSTHEISDQLQKDIQERLSRAGVAVIEARISHLAYAPEIAAAMLQRQQAHAVVAARAKIVEGAVSMVQMALERLADEKIVEFDPEKRASMVSNLLVVLCSDRHAQPVVNAGSIH
jgi:regulator of protease activity HflC (stomatin/prohibitin superfamily)